MLDLPRFGRGACVARVDALLDACEVDRDRLAARSIMVTGSNGKGSTSAFLSHIAISAGLRVGTFTSPHLFHFNERFRLNWGEISDESLALVGRDVMARVEALSPRFGAGSFGAFEAQFVAAALWFQRCDVDLCVFEAGIGGRLDATRLAGASVTALTSVDQEHTALLGESLEAIALDKSEACPRGGVTVHGENLLPHRELLRAWARLRGVTTVFVGRDVTASDFKLDAKEMRFTLDGPFGHYEDLVTTLKGRFQASNAACAVQAFHAWEERRTHGDRGVFERAVRAGLAATRWPGRLETIAQEPLTVVDVGHTPDAIEKAAEALFEAHGPDGWLLVTGVSSDKDAVGMMELLKHRFPRILCTQAHHKGLDARVVAKLLEGLPGDAEVLVEADIAAATRRAREIARSSGLKIFVAGGLFVAIEYTHAERGGDPGALRFF